MAKLYICPLSALEKTLMLSGARSMIALGGPQADLPRPHAVTDAFLALKFNDIVEPRDGLVAPSMADVEAIIAFAQQWQSNDPMLLQCWMGISRSTAAALIVRTTLRPDLCASSIAQDLRERSPTATPNALMVRLADEALDRQGTLTNAVAEIGRGANASEGTPFMIEI
ncbi:MAG: tyrosine protein phosphatase [Ahrensia sp.]|nr:tyrosine protein phosphatase [Ahrensia sp.]